MYTPPYHITEKMLALTSEIAEKAARLDISGAFERRPYLRRNNRIRSVYSSLAIEANSLSLGDVRAVIGGKTVVGPQNEIQEVQNAYSAYERLGSFDPFSLDDLKRIHGIMTHLTVRESGVFRSGHEGVFSGDSCIFLAPPPEFVPENMENLFAWMNAVRDTLHPLILSSVFHYEFVFIHPFADGNGRMARLWQTALLMEWKPVLACLPLESRIYEYQQDYYDAIAACHTAGESNIFIEFMLDKINLALDQAQQQISDTKDTAPTEKLLAVMEYDVPYSAHQLMKLLGLKGRANFRKLYLMPALQQEMIEMSQPDKPTSKDQMYIRR